jgi:hypothetical protein
MIPKQVGHRIRNEGAGAISRQGDITTGNPTAATIWTIGIIGAAVGMATTTSRSF